MRTNRTTPVETRPTAAATAPVWLVATVAALLLAACDVAAQESLPAEARSRLEYAIGNGTIRGERLDVDGAVTEVIHGRQSASWLAPGRIVQMTDDDPDGGGRSWWAYDAALDAWTLVSIGVERGAVWVLRGSLDEWVITSEPRTLEDGRKATIRFTHYDIQPDCFKALQEVSFDGGTTWTAVYRQTLTRANGAPRARTPQATC